VRNSEECEAILVHLIHPTTKDCAVILRIVAESIDPATMRRVYGIAQGDGNQILIAG